MAPDFETAVNREISLRGTPLHFTFGAVFPSSEGVRGPAIDFPDTLLTTTAASICGNFVIPDRKR